MFFFVEDLTAKKVEGDAADHMLAMRVKYGENYTITNHKGACARIKIQKVDKRHRYIDFWVNRISESSRPAPEFVVFQALLDKQYMDKCVEVLAIKNVSKIVFFQGDNSEERQHNPERLERIVTRSCEQAERLHRPELVFVSPEEAFELMAKYKPMILNQNGDKISARAQESEIQSIVVGPEGGWSEAETDKFNELKLPAVSLDEPIYPGWLAGFAAVHTLGAGL